MLQYAYVNTKKGAEPAGVTNNLPALLPVLRTLTYGLCTAPYLVTVSTSYGVSSSGISVMTL